MQIQNSQTSTDNIKISPKQENLITDVRGSQNFYITPNVTLSDHKMFAKYSYH